MADCPEVHKALSELQEASSRPSLLAAMKERLEPRCYFCDGRGVHDCPGGMLKGAFYTAGKVDAAAFPAELDERGERKCLCSGYCILGKCSCFGSAAITQAKPSIAGWMSVLEGLREHGMWPRVDPVCEDPEWRKDKPSFKIEKLRPGEIGPGPADELCEACCDEFGARPFPVEGSEALCVTCQEKYVHEFAAAYDLASEAELSASVTTSSEPQPESGYNQILSLIKAQAKDVVL